MAHAQNEVEMRLARQEFCDPNATKKDIIKVLCQYKKKPVQRVTAV